MLSMFHVMGVKDRPFFSSFSYLHLLANQMSREWDCPSIIAWSKCYLCMTLHSVSPTPQLPHQMLVLPNDKLWNVNHSHHYWGGTKIKAHDQKQRPMPQGKGITSQGSSLFHNRKLKSWVQDRGGSDGSEEDQYLQSWKQPNKNSKSKVSISGQLIQGKAFFASWELQKTCLIALQRLICSFFSILVSPKLRKIAVIVTFPAFNEQHH